MSFFGEFCGTTEWSGGKCLGRGGGELITSSEGAGASGAWTGGFGFGDEELEGDRLDGAGP